MVFPDINRNYSEYTALNREITDKISHIQSECNDIIEKYRLAICAKTSNIYNPVHTVNHGLEKKIIEFNEVLCTLENNRIAFLEAGKQRKELVQKLIDINKKIAHIHIESIYKNYLKQRHDKQLAEQVTKEKYDKLNEIKNHLFQLELQKKNVNLAINNINNALDYIFFSRERLSIVLKDDKYYLRVNGKDVKPRSISLGERNIIALCYFFTKILENTNEKDEFRAPCLIILDDPISSFDMENKVGLYTFFRMMFDKIMKIVYYICLEVGDFMIFSDEYDRTLRLILLYDKKNRYEIAKLLNCLPLELFENIRIGINKCRNEENKDDILINKAIRDTDGRTLMFRIKIERDKLRINLSRWINDLEENYEFEIVPLMLDCSQESLLLDKYKDDIIYIGGFSMICSRLSSFLGNTIVSEYNCMQYELYEDNKCNIIIQLSDDIIKEKVVKLDMISSDIRLEDICSKKNIRRLIRK